MSAFNLSHSEPITFILSGIDGLEDTHIWISIPYSMIYIISLLGNITVLFVVAQEHTLQKPMFLLLCMLALTDIGKTSCVVPKALCIFWFGYKDITLDGCLFQMFLINMFCTMQSAVIVIMAFDRYVAISDPLRYAAILTNARIFKLGLVGLIRAFLVVLPEPFLLKQLPFCTNRVIPQIFCEQITVVKISCMDTTEYEKINMMTAFLFIGFDLTLVGLSYGLILRAVLRMSSRSAHQKALSTCTVHIFLLLTLYIPSIISAITYKFGQGIATYVHILLPNINLLFPPMLNPIVYGVKTKELRVKVGKYLCRI